MKKRVTKTLQEATTEDIERWMKKLSQGKCRGTRKLRKQLNVIMKSGLPNKPQNPTDSS